MSLDTPLTLGAAFVLGIGGSLHCFAMCGPLACAAQGNAAGRPTRAALYQTTRILAYATVGAILGAIGAGAGRLLSVDMERLLPWVLAAVLIGSALAPWAWLRRLPPPPVLSALLARVALLRARLSPDLQAIVLGAITPLLPCGLLYGVALGAAASGSALAGAELMGGFAFAVVPALLAAQWGSARLARRIPQAWMSRGLPLLAALALIVRATYAASRGSCH